MIRRGVERCASLCGVERCAELGTAYERAQWMGWRRWVAWLLWVAWHDDRARLGLASDCLPEATAEDRAPSRADFRAYACAVLAQAYGEGHRDELAARWRPAWAWWLNAAASDWTDGVRLAGVCAEWVYRRKAADGPEAPGRDRPLDPPLRERARAGDELAARVLGWFNDACLRALREHAQCSEFEEWYGHDSRCQVPGQVAA